MPFIALSLGGVLWELPLPFEISAGVVLYFFEQFSMRVSSSYSSLEGYTNRVGVLFLDFLKVIKSTILSCHKVIPSSGFHYQGL